MAGCRDFSKTEVKEIRGQLRATRNPTRDEALFVLGCNTGFRISSLLSLQVKHVIGPTGLIVDSISIDRRNVKRKQRGHEIMLTKQAREILKKLIENMVSACAANNNAFLFHASNPRKPISKQHAYYIIRTAANKAGLAGHIGTHSMRKTFASRLYNWARTSGKADPLQITQRGLNHKSINSTASYLRVDQDEVNELVRGLKI